MIFFGGSDPTNETAKALEAVRMLNRPDIAVDVVVGAFNPHRKVIEQIGSDLPDCTCHFNVKDMAALMAKADLAVGAGGATTLERMYMGLPSIVITVAENQGASIQALAHHGYLIYAGRYHDVTMDKLSIILSSLSSKILQEMSKKAMKIIDDMGTERVIPNIAF